MSLNIAYEKALVDNYIWILFNENKAIVIDPGESEKVISFLDKNNLTLEFIFLTHGHYDHIDGVFSLKEKYPNVGLFVPIGLDLSLGENIIKEGDELNLINSVFKVINLPGHTDNHIGIIYEDNLFCGDVLFCAGCGRVEHNYEDMYRSLKKIKGMDNKTKIYFSHEYTLENLKFASHIEPKNINIMNYIEFFKKNPDAVSAPTTLLFEKEINPFLRLSENIDIKKEFNDDFDVFVYLRKLKDKFISI
ncbi:hydroxyacylglutathione hydrolase [Edwardsiella anguillarum]|uniref:Hydroxyacylglutathione hydrolase n=1 Tax=Edwardsiella anguillarum TaxID=1821960 RepID=A0ABY8SK07_9GAMM|nr:hydroxyacylglutathione hydrolase [Edwardsiella anguillarum]WHP85870.1 hydroxyacylglutathione hydrolase [Edwardsiella anguillarum]WHP89657.1 hydroxyacylglutathione hydrolase [Edwardsiella anguillarum]WHP93455.1 hydroxyacylglutathione hydrolase [Edwardsiella anguillarum]WHP97267.1 hydroxyacylglutathione hydrolase [Edwardsiella anguillarum]WHQ01127.1 hydroxyacylglutathione hydrolase [Edwardsiella anguillarum]